MNLSYDWSYEKKMVNKSIGLLSLCIKNWHIVSSISMSIVGFIGAIANKIGWQFSVILGYWAGLITLIFCLIVIFIYKYAKLYFNNKQIKREEEQSLITSNNEAENQINIVIEKMAKNELTQEQGRAQALMFARNFGNIRMQNLENSLNQFCSAIYPNQTLSNNQKDILYSLLEQKYKPFRMAINILVENKILPLIPQNLISKQTVNFINNITDEDLEIIKTQFMYVSGKKGILYYEKIIDEIMTPCNLWLTQIDMIKFQEIWGDVFNVVTGKVLNVSSKTTISLSFKSNSFIKIENISNITKEIKYFITLNQIGTELYELLKDEIQNTPITYVQKCTDYINQDCNIKAKILSIAYNPLSPTQPPQ